MLFGTTPRPRANIVSGETSTPAAARILEPIADWINNCESPVIASFATFGMSLSLSIVPSLVEPLAKTPANAPKVPIP